MIESATFLKWIPLLRWIVDSVYRTTGKKREFYIQLKAVDENNLMFWLIHEPNFPGETIFAKISINGSSDGIACFWPSKWGIPFGCRGDPKKACYSVMMSAQEAEERISSGNTQLRLAESAHIDKQARSRWGGTHHCRACFSVSRGIKNGLKNKAKIELLLSNGKVIARKIVKLRSIA